ncbi:MAG: DUF1573 domain-containing protein [Rikenellaceae bacterium]|nr:DUF1573 domain-containing protein [Rikenellaceae bacterium]
MRNSRLTYTLIYCWIVLAPIFARAQTARILSFEEPTRELGTILEADGLVKVLFEYTNIADKEVSIVDIYTQCGCASPRFDTKPIAPGGTGMVEVTFDPKGKFGDFRYGLTVTATNGDYNKYNTLILRGHVVNSIPIDEIKYPAGLSQSLRADIPAVGMRLIRRGQSRIRSMKIYNTTQDMIQLAYNPNSPYLVMKGPAVIRPGEEIEVEFTLNSRLMPLGDFTIMSTIRAGIEEIGIEVKGAVEQ